MHSNLPDEFIDAVQSVCAASLDEINEAVDTSRSMCVRPARALIESGIINDTQLARIVAERPHPDFVTVRTADLNADIATALPLGQCTGFKVVPYRLIDGVLGVVSIDPVPEHQRVTIRRSTPHKVEFKLTSPQQFNPLLAALNRFAAGDEIGVSHDESIEQAKTNWAELVDGGTATSNDIAELLTEAAATEASDIHLCNEIIDDSAVVTARLRIDGDLELVRTWAVDEGTRIISRFKVAGIHETSEVGAFDGNHDIWIPEVGRYDMRLSLLPLRNGLMLTIRMLSQGQQLARSVASLYPTQQSDITNIIENALAATAGIVIVAGGTGDGKSTTLAAMVSHVADPTRKVVTLENPVEALIPGAQQIPITKGLSFADALRAVLRSDPDVVMIGEIRDAETAMIAVEAATTGHLIVSTVHARFAAAAPLRLLELGVNAVQLAEELRLVLSQRLVKRLCRRCSAGGQPVGCEACREGFAGRVAVGETLVIDNDVRPIIETGASPRTLRDSANYQPFKVHAEALLEAQQTTQAQLVDKLGAESL